MPSDKPLYDRIGVGYASRRRSDPRILSQILRALSNCETVLNVGAGTGSYEPPSCLLAIEPSWEMIRQRPPASTICAQAVAEHLPLRDKSFDGSLASLTIHHWKDPQAGLAEMRRVTRKRIVLFTWDPDAEHDFWLTRDYFPSILEMDRQRFPSIQQIAEVLQQPAIETVPIPADCEDGLIGAFWKRPEVFLDPAAQRTNSAMAQLDDATLQAGICRLREDLKTGAWSERNSSLESRTEFDLGYRLIISENSTRQDAEKGQKPLANARGSESSAHVSTHLPSRDRKGAVPPDPFSAAR